MDEEYVDELIAQLTEHIEDNDIFLELHEIEMFQNILDVLWRYKGLLT